MTKHTTCTCDGCGKISHSGAWSVHLNYIDWERPSNPTRKLDFCSLPCVSKWLAKKEIRDKQRPKIPVPNIPRQGEY